MNRYRDWLRQAERALAAARGIYAMISQRLERA